MQTYLHKGPLRSDVYIIPPGVKKSRNGKPAGDKREIRLRAAGVGSELN